MFIIDNIEINKLNFEKETQIHKCQKKILIVSDDLKFSD